MIKANELRIGNILQDEIGLEKGLIVYKIEEDIITCGDNNFSHPYLIETLMPIPLTHEILEKAGFYLAPQRISIYLKRRIQLWMGHNGCIAYLRHEDKDERYYIGDCHYLHQLQNLYFALTGEELQINL